jgi:hypothetical protein
VALAFVLYYGMDGLGPGGDVSNGELLLPTVALPSLAQVPVLQAGRATDDEPLRLYWNIVHVTGDGCGEVCQQALADSAKVRFLLVKELDRVSRVLLTVGPSPDLALAGRALPGPDRAGPRRRWRGGGGRALEMLGWDGTEGVLHVTDPRTNLVMRYADWTRTGWACSTI